MLWNPEMIRSLMYEAGAIALRYYDSPEIRMKADRTIVTQADGAVENFLRNALLAANPDTYVLGEESEAEITESDLSAALDGTLYIIDPIDGTSPYAHHLPTWGVSLGMASNGRLTEGAIYLPVTDELYLTQGDGVTYWAEKDSEGVRLPPPDPACELSTMVAVSQKTARHGGAGFPNPILAISCAVSPLMSVAHGRVMAYCSRVKLWDLAGSLPILERLGLTTRRYDGTPFTNEISPENYDLSPSSETRWLQTSLCVFSVPQAYDYLKPYLKPAD